MSALSSMAIPGRIPMSGDGAGMITPESLFGSPEEKAAYRRLVGGSGNDRNPGISVRKVEVRIFDLSDRKQVLEYEKLWAMLLEKTARMEVVVESRKDLVHRSDGTSYWMKYVEYVEFGEASDESNSREQNGRN